MNGVVKIKYPLACGCAGSNYISKCANHQVLDISNHQRLMGIPLRRENIQLRYALKQAIAYAERNDPKAPWLEHARLLIATQEGDSNG